MPQSVISHPPSAIPPQSAIRNPQSLPNPGLLVSVRSAAEAEAALAGGATLVDVKEPARGPLGRADTETIAAVVQVVGGRVPLSAALGELCEGARLPPDLEEILTFLKWGLAGCQGRKDWRQELTHLGTASFAQVVVVGYADWRLADAPPLAEVCAFACQRPGNVLLLDTFAKGLDRSLLDWLSLERIEGLCRRCRQAGVRIALAGSLGPAEIRTLMLAAPDWFAVRGAACAERRREAPVCVDKVRQLVELLVKR